MGKGAIDENTVIRVSQSRYAQIVLLDFLIFTAFWALLVRDHAGLPPWAGMAVFALLEAFILSYKKWMFSPGMYISGVYQAIAVFEGKTQPVVARLVDPAVWRHETPATRLLGVLYFWMGLKLAIYWLEGPAYPVFGVILPQAGFVLASLLFGVLGMAAGFGYLRLRPWAAYAGWPFLLLAGGVYFLNIGHWNEVFLARAADAGKMLEPEAFGFVKGLMRGIFLLLAGLALLAQKRLRADGLADDVSRNFMRYYARRNAALLGVFLLVACGKGIFFAPDRMQQTLVADEAGLFSPQEKRYLAAYHKKLRDAHDIDYRVVTAVLQGGIERESLRKFADLGAGKLSASGRGLLLLIDPEGRGVRLEVSSSLESVYTDAFVSYIQNRQMFPFFKSGKVADGILATTEMIYARAQEAVAGRAFSPPMESRALGGGVTNEVAIGSGEDNTFRQGPDVQAAAGAADPRAVLAASLSLLEQRNGNPGLSIYSADSRAMLAKWTVTPAQMDNEARSIRSCPAGELKSGSGRAVLRRPAAARQCPPYFFVFEDGAWRLDFTMMQKAVRFNHRNEWRFDPRVRHAYEFAFTDWRFDKNGFPH